MAKTICWFQYTKKIEAEKNWGIDGKALYKLMYNGVHGLTKQNQCKTCEQKKAI